MFKKGALALLLLCTILYSSCKKEDSITPQEDPSGSAGTTGHYSSGKYGNDITSTNIDNPATYKCMYVDDANNIVGSTAQENSLISYAAANGINAFAFYGLKSVIQTSAGYAKMASFLNRCTQSGITNFVYVVVYYNGSVNGLDTTYIRKYNNSRSNVAEKFTAVNLEWEWWNGATTWATYLLTMKSYYNWTRTVSPTLANEIYFGWFKNPLGLESTMANEMVTYCDRIVLHDYRSSPDVAYMKSRMDYLGQAAINQGKIKKIVVLFSAESSFMGPYYSTHTYNDAYQSIVSQYTAATFNGKSGIRVYGWQVFKYSVAKICRP